MTMTDKKSRIFVAGHRGLVGSALVRKLQERGYANLQLRTRSELDLLNQAQVTEFFKNYSPEYVFLAAAKVGGIKANDTYPADFLYENLMIASNVIHASAKFGVQKLLFLGSSCIYPRLAPQPIHEDSLLTGPLEQTNEAYAIAKIAGLKLCQMYMRQYQKQFISAMPTNMYGPYDNFHPENSHVIPGLIRRFHEAKIKSAKEVVVWGTGKPMREFLFVDDLADALVMLMQNYSEEQSINVGTGEDQSILEIATLIKQVVGFQGSLRFDPKYPDGTPRKLMDVSRIHKLGWKHKVNLFQGLKMTYDWALENRFI